MATVEETRAKSPRSAQRTWLWGALLAVPTAWMVAFFVSSMVIIVLLSFGRTTNDGYPAFALRTANYRAIWNDVYFELFVRSVTYALATVVISVLVAAPIYFRQWGWSASSSVWIPLRWLGLTIFTAFAFAVVYRYGPCRARARWRWVSAGGMLAAILWLGGSLGFSWYLNHVAHFDATYGSLGAVIGFMMWIWSSVIVVLVGAELNAEIEHQTAVDSTTGRPLPIGERGAAMADSVGVALKMNAQEGARHVWGVGLRMGRNLVRDIVGLPGRVLRPAFSRAHPPASTAGRPDPRRSAD